MTLDYYKRNFFNTAVADIFRALDGKSKIGSFILTFCLIDYLAWIEYGTQKESFNKWIEKRLIPLNFNYSNKARELYSVRCGLVHTYGPSKEMIKEVFSGYQLYDFADHVHMEKVNTTHLKICLYSFLTEVAFAANQTFIDIEIDQNVDKIERLEKQITVLDVLPPKNYKDMHTVLHVFDDPVEISLVSLQQSYLNHFIYH